jgi:hypothetical protein
MSEESIEASQYADDGIAKLEAGSGTDDLDIEQLLKEYRALHARKPLWRLVEDIQRQAMLYTNIIELLKHDKSAEDIRKKMEELGLVPPSTLPNPHIPTLLTRALNKIAQYRRALVEVIRRYGGELLNELEFEPGLTISVGVAIGFPPSVTIAVEHTASAKTITRY